MGRIAKPSAAMDGKKVAMDRASWRCGEWPSNTTTGGSVASLRQGTCSWDGLRRSQTLLEADTKPLPGGEPLRRVARQAGFACFEVGPAKEGRGAVPQEAAAPC